MGRKTRPAFTLPSDSGVIVPRRSHNISKTDISPNALKVLNRLDHANYAAFLVGGAVRDLLLGKAPKDFDVSTNAHPEEVRKLFRNCRLIGKRFRLAHILYGKEIIEVATFRAPPSTDEKHAPEHHATRGNMVVRDNIYGTFEEDAWRRDFTVNALYYNIADFSVVDFTGGMQDIQNKLIRIIGNAQQRYEEDPVRMLRAVRFATKLGFNIEDETKMWLSRSAHLLKEVSPARLFEEVLKLFQRGHGLDNFNMLREYNLFETLFPLTDKILNAPGQYPVGTLLKLTLESTDSRINNLRTVTPAFLFAALMWHPLQAKMQELQVHGYLPLVALEMAMSGVIIEQNRAILIPKRFTMVMREIWLLQYRFPKRYGKRPFKILEHPRFRAAYDFLLLRCDAGEEDAELGQWWTQFQSCDESEQEAMLTPEKPKRRRRKASEPDASE